MSENQPKKVLVIDDEQAIVDELVSFLFQHGYMPTVCMNADDALVSAQSEVFDLIISDINLGMVSGLELCQRIHELENANETPVIFLSGAQIPDIIRRSRSAGGTYYVRKPFDPEVMVELMDKAMWFPVLTHSHIRRTSEQFEMAMAEMS
ncbi:MAG: response regulator [Planctomycetaceae bacterium]|nr:response regulator [Planctomycetaceae bacterium]